MPGKIGALLLAACAACGGNQPVVNVDPNVTPLSPPLPVGKVFILESWGTPPDDTTVTFLASEPRTIVVRRGGPDNSLFARVTFPAGTITPARGDSATVRVTIRPGAYGIDITTEDRIAAARGGAEVTFSYAIHFIAPDGARAVYGTDLRFERYLGIGRLEADSMLVFLDSWRPASDLLTARLTGPGQYLVAAPRAPPGFRAIVF
ncbi:MAG TPA: hypothetical protein VF862_07095 [Gemmatimonadales bacterium]